jgi:hypothetical protein
VRAAVGMARFLVNEKRAFPSHRTNRELPPKSDGDVVRASRVVPPQLIRVHASAPSAAQLHPNLSLPSLITHTSSQPSSPLPHRYSVIFTIDYQTLRSKNPQTRHRSPRLRGADPVRAPLSIHSPKPLPCTKNMFRPSRQTAENAKCSAENNGQKPTGHSEKCRGEPRKVHATA